MLDRNTFDIDLVLNQPLIAHLSHIHQDEPWNSPVWFLWETGCVWLFGRRDDGFVNRLSTEPQCALGIVDFAVGTGTLRHVGIRGVSTVHKVDRDRLHRFLAKYLGPDRKSWNAWFVSHVVDALDTMIEVTPRAVIANDGSFFQTGPHLASCV